MLSSADELLRETVAHLEQTLHRERESRREAEGLLAGVGAAATARSLTDAESALLTALAPVFGYEAGAVLSADTAGYRATATTTAALAEVELAVGKLLQRVEQGEVVAVFDVARVPDLQGLARVPEVCAALMLPLRTSRGVTILLGVHARAAAFSPRLVALARHFQRMVVPVLESLVTREREHLGNVAAARAAALEQSNAVLQQRVEEIERQRAQILRLSAPVLQVWRDVLTVPITGALEEQQIAHVCEKLLEAICNTRARVAILDMTGLESIEVTAAERLHGVFHAVRLLGVHCFVSGVQPGVADALVSHGAVPRVATFATVADALAAAIRTCGQSPASRSR
ncbi:STAS domain-containing protein [Nannocystis radixulma]|uniref:STAS domain-containing protein n=1 Tax=Nannocystis radixulma TaxID=2995305 RepID=A0ABT5BFJ0_9BACT|nr:STAS domain-containing protein [Nannocystis radixulma]MDC0672915.1 STAS domain-containing protein [Nannocystis radixulma]